MQIKIFTGSDIGRIEKDVNEFMKNKEVIDIKQSESFTSVVSERNGKKFTETIWSLTIAVIYKEKKESVYESRGILSG
jgi:hypothetical protein